MNNDNNSDNLKLWVGIFLVILMLSPFIIKEVIRDGKSIKDDITVGRY